MKLLDWEIPEPLKAPMIYPIHKFRNIPAEKIVKIPVSDYDGYEELLSTLILMPEIEDWANGDLIEYCVARLPSGSLLDIKSNVLIVSIDSNHRILIDKNKSVAMPNDQFFELFARHQYDIHGADDSAMTVIIISRKRKEV